MFLKSRLIIKYNLMVVLDKCVPQQTSNFVGWLRTAFVLQMIQSWLLGTLCKSDTIPVCAEQYKGSGTVSVLSSSYFPNMSLLQLMAIIAILSLVILLTFNFHIVSVSNIVTYEKCLSDDNHLSLYNNSEGDEDTSMTNGKMKQP